MASMDKSGKDANGKSVKLEASAPRPHFDGKGDIIPSKPPKDLLLSQMGQYRRPLPSLL
jgi:hypothetical protein